MLYWKIFKENREAGLLNNNPASLFLRVRLEASSLIFIRTLSQPGALGEYEPVSSIAGWRLLKVQS